MMNTRNGHVRLVGDVRVERDGVAVELPPSRKTRGLLAYLLWTGRAHRRAQLCGLLWADAVDPKGALRWTLSRLRAVFPGEARLRTERGAVAFDPEGLFVDVRAIRHLAHGAHDVPTETLAFAVHALEEADFLEGLDLPECPDFHAWCVAAREEVRDATVTVLRALVRRLAGSAPERSAAYARRWVRLDREDDRAHAALLEALEALGRRREMEEHDRSHRAWQARRDLLFHAPFRETYCQDGSWEPV